ncbi:hypothetical protein FQA39_LY16030 [Lamprigera yunnana]|nr:hypothetical protein FQA39_LY16030 [Lamprigera yunnana]
MNIYSFVYRLECSNSSCDNALDSLSYKIQQLLKRSRVNFRCFKSMGEKTANIITEDAQETNKGIDNRDQIKEEELNQAKNKIKIRKSPGCDKFSPEMVQCLGKSARQYLIKLFNLKFHKNRLTSAAIEVNIKTVTIMGKSDLNIFSTKMEVSERDRPKLFTIGPCQKEQNEYEENKISMDLEPFSHQAAGHMSNGKTVGMLRQNGSILKPIFKNSCGDVEIKFYEDLENTTDECCLQLKQFVPKYYGTKTISFNNKEVNCIVLEDLTKHFKEPCILDVKIGKRTWDPFASYEKMIRENNKYQETKRELGICIPGFLVHEISTGKVTHYGKEYGNFLNRETIKEALKTFLNADIGLSRDLLLQFVVELWRILRWARHQKKFKIFSSSLLFVYDAKRLRKYPMNTNSKLLKDNRNQSLPSYNTTLKRFNLYKPLSLLKLNDNCAHTGFSGLFNKDGPILHSTPFKFKNFFSASVREKQSKTSDPANKLRRVHSFQNNYDKDLQKIRKDYKDMLRNLVDDNMSDTWATVKMIDFAHVYPQDYNEIDSNYLEGIESVVKLFEDILSETTIS